MHEATTLRKYIYNIFIIISLAVLSAPILDLHGQDCEPPYDLSAIEVTTTTALLRWENDNYYYGPNTRFHIVVSPSALADPSSVPVTADIQGTSLYMTYLIEDLSPATDYHFYVRSACGTENSDWENGTFRTSCSDKSIPYSENFNSYNAVQNTFPTCWTSIQGNPHLTNVNAEQSNALQLPSYSMVALPTFNLPLDTLRIHFSMMAFSTATSLIVGVTENPGEFYSSIYTPIDTLRVTTEYVFEEKTVLFSNYTGQGRYILFYNTNNSLCYIDDITVSIIPNCLSPINVQARDVQANSATLTWNEAGTATQWQVLLSTTAISDFSSLTPISCSSPTYPATSLSPNTTYHFYVRAQCSGDGSEWATTSFTTACTPSTLPSPESFTENMMPACWSCEYVVGTADISFVENGTDPFCYPAAGTAMVQWACSNYGEGWQSRLRSLPLNTTGTAAVCVNFKWNHDLSNSSGLNDGVQIQYSTDGVTWTNSAQGMIRRYDGIHNGWTEYDVIVPEAGNQSLVYIGFLFNSGNNSSNCYLDEVNFHATNSCFTPVNVRVSDIVGNSATLSWDEVGNASAWDLLLSDEPVTDFTNANPITVSDTFHTVDDLNPVTTYYVYVRSRCSENSSSEWTSAVTFVSDCGFIHTLPHTESFDSYGTCTNAFPPCWIRHGFPELGTFIHSGQVCRTPSATDMDAIDGNKSLVISSPSSCYTYTITPPIQRELRTLAMTFYVKQSSAAYSGTLEVGVISNPNDPATFESIATITPDSTGVWIFYPVSFSHTNLNGLGNRIAFRHFGMVDDHYFLIDQVRIIEAPDCWQALRPSVQNITGNSATLRWLDFNEPASQWRVKVSDTPMSDPSLTANVYDQTITASSLTLDYLSGGTTYYYYVQSDCGNNMAGAPVSGSFTTLPCNCYVDICMSDRWANGWEGAKIQMKHGSTVFAEASMTHNGSRDTIRVYTCDDLTINYWFVSGNYDSDISFTIVNSLGHTIYASSGTPVAGCFLSEAPECGVSCGTAPDSLTVTATAEGHSLTWEAAPDALSYSVYRRNTLIADYVTATSYLDTEAGTEDTCYTVTARCIVGESGPSSEACLHTHDTIIDGIITGGAGAPSVSIFPNPAKDKFTVSAAFSISRISVVNLLGQEVIRKEGTGNRTEINVSELPDGIYLVKIHDGKNWVVRKIIVE